MPETYPGQTEVVRTKLQQAELLMQANQERLQAETDPDKRASLLQAIASQSGIVGSYRRHLAKCESESDETRSDSIRVRLSPAERSMLESKAASAGQTIAQYIRQQCGV